MREKPSSAREWLDFLLEDWEESRGQCVEIHDQVTQICYRNVIKSQSEKRDLYSRHRTFYDTANNAPGRVCSYGNSQLHLITNEIIVLVGH